MATVIGDISVPVDGFVTGPDPGPGQGLGRGGATLHTWALDGDPADREIATTTAATGCVIMGHTLFDGPDGGTDEMGYGAAEAAVPPVQGLLEHLAPVLLGGGTPLFTGGPPGALRQVHGRATHLTYGVA